MSKGILEVVIVSAKGIGHTNVIGEPAYYVNIECGDQVKRSNISKEAMNGGKNKEIFWNEKFTFEFPSNDWKKWSYLKLKVMDEELFTDGGFVGETIVDLKGIIEEGKYMGAFEIRPTPYNVVLEDDTYKGEIKIGLKFITNKQACSDERDFVKEEDNLRELKCKTVTKGRRIPCWGFLFFRKNKNC